MIQTGPATLSVRLELAPDADERQASDLVTDRLSAYLSAQGLPAVRIEKAPEPPALDPASGKVRAVIAAGKRGPDLGTTRSG